MTQLLLSTKLFFPRARSKLVSRPRLIEQLNSGLRKPLTLISAPAGYGKTTLLSDWRLQFGSEYPLAWLSLDPDDNNLARFLTYVSAALEILDPRLPKDLITLLQLPQLPPMEELLTALINGVNTFPQDFSLVLDDCHAITDPAIHAALAYLLDHLPPKMHLMMLTRADPPIHLAKLRARGDLVELRTDDLRFTSEEAADFLNIVMDLNLSGENVSALDLRTEGWIVGLQIAALSMQGKADADGFIKAFTGSNRYILDFLTEEVLQQQPEQIRTFLLQTSILDRLSGPLCDAVLGGSNNGAQILTELERKNLFLIPLDDERLWYRYHHLFSDLLFQCLKQTRPEQVNELYMRAEAWYEQNGYLENSVGYALKAHHYDLATRLMNQIKDTLWGRGDIRGMVSWLNTLPADHVRSQPEICRAYAVMMTMEGYFDAAENWFRLAEDSLGSTQITDPVLAMRFRIIPLYRSVNARFHGDYRRAINLCQGVLDQTSVTEVRPMGVALLFLGQAHFYAGNTQLADQVLTDSIQFNLASGHLSAYLNASHHLAKLRVLQGRLQEARTIYEQATRLAGEQATPVYAGTEYAGLGDLEREWNQLDSAAARIQKGILLAEAGDHIFFLMDVYLAGLRLSMAQSDWETARRYLSKAEQAARRCPTSIENGHLRAWQARLHLAQGEVAAASSWAETIEKMAGETPSDPQFEFALLTLARIWLAQGKTSQAASLLERVRTGAEEAGRGGRLLEAEMLQALADQAAGLEKHAVEKIIQVLDQAEPEGFLRLFVDEGAPLAKLLYKAAPQLTAPLGDYAERLLAVYFQEEGERQAVQARTAPGEGLIKPLSEREQEVLRLVAAGKTNQEIAAELYIAIGTVKRHAINIFTKLDVKNRTEAVAKARELGLLDSR